VFVILIAVLGLGRPRQRAAARSGAVTLLLVSAALWGWAGDGEPTAAPGQSPTRPTTTDRREEAPDEPAPPPAPLRPRLAVPSEQTTVLAADTAATQAAAVSAAFFARAPVVVLAVEGDPAAQARGASAAVDMGVPLLLTPLVEPGRSAGTGTDAGGPQSSSGASPDDRPSSAGEPDRTPPGEVRDSGATASQGGSEPAGPEPGAGTPDRASAASPAATEVARLAPEAVLAFGPDAAAWARAQRLPGTAVVAPSASAGADPDSGPARRALARLPDVAPAEPADGSAVVVVDRAAAGAAGAAALATARAAGATVVPVTGPDPRVDREAIAALAAAAPLDRVVALGSAFGSADLLRRRLEVAATGAELPGGGQVLFPGRRLVALYGHPGAPVLGVLGEQPVEAAVARARTLAAGYQPLVGEPVVPAFEIITTVASASAGPDGNYSNESEVAELRPWVDAAGRAGVYVVLDLQPGTTDFLTQAQRYAELLAEPHVGLALDPEWRLAPGQRHMAQIGSVTAGEVNAVAGWLAAFTREHHLPQKLLLLHQFQARMISDRATVDTSHDELAVLVHADGFGTPGQKFDTWRALRVEPLADAWWGWKNFVDEDQPTFTPAQTVAIDPAPRFVSYQ
jgi:hypothetical protein